VDPDPISFTFFFEPKDCEARAPQQFIERLKDVCTTRDKKGKKKLYTIQQTTKVPQNH
jgi:hypothetical protein